MSARDKSRFSPRQAAWVAVGIFAAWLAFLLVPASRKVRPPASTELPPMAAQSKLESIGLANNPDWQGLPGYFDVWADSLDWLEDKVVFAYWNPGSQTYSYFFEATRRDKVYRFRAITLRELEARSVDYFWEDDEMSFAQASEQRTPSNSHPFIFFSPLKITVPSGEGGKPILRKPAVPKVDVHIEAEPLKVPPALNKKPDDPSK